MNQLSILWDALLCRAQGLDAGGLIALVMMSALIGCKSVHTSVDAPRQTSTSQVAEEARAAVLDQIADRYVRLVLALGERDTDSLDFAIVPAAMREEEHRRYRSLDEITHEADASLNQVRALRSPVEQRGRAEFLALQLEALEARAQMLQGHMLKFDDEARALFATTRAPDQDGRERAAVRMRVALLLTAEEGPGASKSQTAAERFAAYDRRFAVPPAQLEKVMHTALELCRQRTAEHISLPAGESVELSFVRNRPWSAFSRYLGHAHSTIEVNLDYPITVDDALELACHEGYPGHHVFNTLRDVMLAQQARLKEADVQPTFSPQSYVSEAAAAYAPQMAFSLREREKVERDVLFPMAGLNPSFAKQYVLITRLVRSLDSAEPEVARAYLDGDLEFARATQQLAAESLVAHGEPLLLYLNEYRSYMLAYTDGPRRVAAFVEANGAKNSLSEDDRQRDRWTRYASLMRQMRFDLADDSSNSGRR